MRAPPSTARTVRRLHERAQEQGRHRILRLQAQGEALSHRRAQLREALRNAESALAQLDALPLPTAQALLARTARVAATRAEIDRLHGALTHSAQAAAELAEALREALAQLRHSAARREAAERYQLREEREQKHRQRRHEDAQQDELAHRSPRIR